MTSAILVRGNPLGSSKPLLLGLAATAFLLGYVGPFGTTESYGQFRSTVLWALVIVLSILSVHFLRRVVSERTEGWRDWKRELLILVVFTLIYTPQLRLLLWMFNPQKGFSLQGILELGAEVFAIALWSMAMRYVLRLWKNEGAVLPDQPRLMERLENTGSAEIVHLAAEDHYVVVGLSDGSTQRILMRLADAMAEMDGIEGFTTHRSHWVAASAVAGSRREKGRSFIKLTSGAEVPVSRGYQGSLKEAGLLA